MIESGISIFWHRRDLRLTDNAGAFLALNSGLPVLPLFIFDTEILDKLEDKVDARVGFINQELAKIKKELNSFGSDILVYHGKPMEVWKEIISKYPIKKVFTNRDYEPYALERDKSLFEFFQDQDIEFKGAKDHVIFEKNDVLKDDGKPYTVFTPFSKKWLAKLTEKDYESYNNKAHFENYLKIAGLDFPSLADLGFEKTNMQFPDYQPNVEIVKHYSEKRNFPGITGTTRIGIHLRFGTISIREMVRIAKNLNQTWLNELIWRDFYHMILYHFPQIPNKAFKPAYDGIEWQNNEADFEKWCAGKTGYPLVDAGMRELNTTGFMHNRVRMLVASFLCKHLLIDWRWGEAYFAKKLLDYDMAANVGGWQWAAGSGNDAAPYFRIFSPMEQLKKFDSKLTYVKKYVPEFGTNAYPAPIIDHKFARARALEVYNKALKG